MNLSLIDWTIVVVFLIVITAVALHTRRYSKSVVDFLAANRCAGRYLIATGDAASTIGAISIMAYFEMFYAAGFTALWWMMMGLFTSNIIALTGWQIYRFRETRAMTLAQFFEIRYGRKFRIYTGTIGFISGVLNFGIFPAIGSRFFIHFCGFPEQVNIIGIQISSLAIIMATLVSVSVAFTFFGGQITVIVAEFFSGTFMYGVFVIIIASIMFVLFRWDRLMEGVSYASANASLVDPFNSFGIKNFNIWYFIIGIFNGFLNFMAWQGNAGNKCSAKSPHEAKMAGILGTWRPVLYMTAMVLLAISAYMVMHLPDYSDIAAKINVSVSNVQDNSPTGQLSKQMLIPLALLSILPKGLVGAFCALMLAAFICTNMTYLQSWGSILIQDIVLPLRGRSIAPRQHLHLLRVSILCVAIFIFVFSLVYRITDDILMYFAITSAIFLGGVGSVIVGGLYWKRGTTAAAFSAMTIGMIISVVGIIVQQIWPYYNDGEKFPINGQVLLFIAIVSSIITYVAVSLLGAKVFNMDRMLHRGEFADNDDHKIKIATGLKAFVIGSEATKTDKLVYAFCLGWGLFWLAIFTIGSICNMVYNIEISSWTKFWYFWVLFNFVTGTAIWIWLTIGGFCNLVELFSTLRTVKRDMHDDGSVKYDTQKYIVLKESIESAPAK